MSCPSEPLLAVHADDELPTDEALRLEAHLGGCSRCRGLFQALRVENRLLSRVLEEAPNRSPARPTALAELGLLGLLLLAATAGLQALLSWLGSLGQDAPFQAMSGRSRVVGMLFEAFFYLLREGASMLTSLLTTFGVLALVGLVFLIGWSLRRRATAVWVLLLVLVVLVAPARALERRIARGEGESVVVKAGETVDDSLLAVGESVSVDGVVTGNLLAFSRRVTVRGTVRGDLVTGAQRVEIAGAVEGNVLSFSETVTIRGPVGKSLHSVAQHVGLAPEGRVEGDVFAFAEEADLDGHVSRDLLTWSGLTNLRGEVARNFSAWTGRLRVEAPARIGGDIVAHVDRKEAVFVDPGASVGGKTETRLPVDKGSRFSDPGFYVWKAVWLAAALVTGLLLNRLLPSLFAGRLGDARTLLGSLGIGFVGLVAAPVAIILIGVTMVGLPVALIALGLWLAALYLSPILVSALLGRMVLPRRGGQSPPFAFALFVGLLMLTVAGSVPYLGGLVTALVIPIGLGLGLKQVARSWRPIPAAS